MCGSILIVSKLCAFSLCQGVKNDSLGSDRNGKDVIGEWDEWFSPSDGIASFSTLVDAIQSQPSLLARLNDADGVVKTFKI